MTVSITYGIQTNVLKMIDIAKNYGRFFIIGCGLCGVLLISCYTVILLALTFPVILLYKILAIGPEKLHEQAMMIDNRYLQIILGVVDIVTRPAVHIGALILHGLALLTSIPSVLFYRLCNNVMITYSVVQIIQQSITEPGDIYALQKLKQTSKMHYYLNQTAVCGRGCVRKLGNILAGVNFYGIKYSIAQIKMLSYSLTVIQNDSPDEGIYTDNPLVPILDENSGYHIRQMIELLSHYLMRIDHHGILNIMHHKEGFKMTQHESKAIAKILPETLYKITIVNRFWQSRKAAEISYFSTAFWISVLQENLYPLNLLTFYATGHGSFYHSINASLATEEPCEENYQELINITTQNKLPSMKEAEKSISIRRQKQAGSFLSAPCNRISCPLAIEALGGYHLYEK